MNYNRDEHLLLLKKNIEPESQVKILKYFTMVNGYLDWYSRKKYLEIFKNLISNEIDYSEFLRTFYETNELTSNVTNTLESNLTILSPNELSLGDNIVRKSF